MTIRQRILKLVYPLFTAISSQKPKAAQVLSNEKKIQPAQSFYDLAATLTTGEVFHFDALKGKKVLLVNTASDCGYTNQYEDLQHLYEQYKNSLEIIAFPANDFKEQEKGDDTEIASFCKKNYGVTFPLAKKSVVIANANQHPVFRWLSDKNKNGWNDQQPVWNFSKYLVDENGMLTHYFAPAQRPTDDVVINAVKA